MTPPDGPILHLSAGCFRFNFKPKERIPMKTLLALAVCLMLATPAYAQQSQERQSLERKATFFFWTGIGVAAAGITPMMAGYNSVGVPFVAGGGALIYYGIHLNNKAKQLPSTTFGVAPVRKGVAFTFNRSW